MCGPVEERRSVSLPERCKTEVLWNTQTDQIYTLIWGGGGGGGQPEKRRKKTMSILGFYRGGSSFFDLNFVWV